LRADDPCADGLDAGSRLPYTARRVDAHHPAQRPSRLAASGRELDDICMRYEKRLIDIRAKLIGRISIPSWSSIFRSR
jgi:hypothetical protein